MTIKRIGIIVAMDKEFAQLRTLLDDAREEQNHHYQMDKVKYTKYLISFK